MRPDRDIPLLAPASRRAVLRAGILALVMRPRLASAAAAFSRPEAVAIAGYGGDAMEPFLSRDGQYLFFNDRNDPGRKTSLHWAEAGVDNAFRYRGEIEGVNTSGLQGVPSMDRDGNFYFVTTRSYDQTLSTIYRGRFGAGRLEGIELVEGLSPKRPGIVNFDAEISADGQFLYGVDGDLSGGPAPKSARFFVARRDGARFQRLPDSDRLLASVNGDRLQYAACISADGLEFFYTRVGGFLVWRGPQIMRATRGSMDEPFGEPHAVAGIDGFVEGPALSDDGRNLYFHKLIDKTYRIYRVRRSP